MRTYTARLIGSDGALVLHGGGNTSVKATGKTALGEAIEVLHIKGSGWDLATIEPPGHPAVRLEPLRRLRALSAMTDEAMVNELRTNLLEASAPTPSVETLLHAFLPAKFVDHTHADAILALADQPDGKEHLRVALRQGPRVDPVRDAGLRPREAVHRGVRACRGARRADGDGARAARSAHVGRDGGGELRAHGRRGVAPRSSTRPTGAARWR